MNRLTILVTTATATAAAAVTAAVIAGPPAVGSPTARAGTAQVAPGAAPDGARRAAPYRVVARVNKEVVTVGQDVVKVRGRVRPRAAGGRVVLQRRVHHARTWSVVTRATIRRNGTFLLVDRPEDLGIHRYRVRKFASRGVRRGTSAALHVQVYGWQKLAQRPRGAYENIAVSSMVLIDGQPYAYSFQPFVRGAPSYVEYPLAGRCTRLRATYAMHDSAAEGSSSRITLAVDGVVKADQVLVKGQVVGSTADLTGALTLRYDLFSTADPASYPAVVVPEARCTK